MIPNEIIWNKMIRNKIIQNKIWYNMILSKKWYKAKKNDMKQNVKKYIAITYAQLGIRATANLPLKTFQGQTL